MSLKRYLNICGIDGCGKSTLAKNLAIKLNAKYTYEPDATNDITKQLRKFALDTSYNISSYARECLMVSNRAISSQIKREYLDNNSNSIIVSDRGLLSGYVYAHVDSNFTYEDWRELHRYNFSILKPDLIIYVESNKQKISKSDNDIYDHRDKAFFNTIANTYIQSLEIFKIHDDIPYIKFYNNFNLSAEENVNILINKLKKDGHIES